MSYPDVSVKELDSAHGKRENANAINNLLGRVNVLETQVGSLEGRVDAIEGILPEFVLAGYGGVRLDTTTAGNALGGTWDTLDYIYDSNVFAVSRGISQDFTNGNILFNLPGVWRVDALIAFEHGESNSGRQTRLRIQNETDLTATEGLIIPIARNQPATSVLISVLVDISADSTGDPYVIQIGNGDIVTGITYENAIFEANHVGEYIQPDPDDFGPELVANNQFQDPGDWTYGNGWSRSIINEYAQSDGSLGELTQDVAITPGTSYRFSCRTDGLYLIGQASLGVSIGDGTSERFMASDGLHVFNLTAAATDTVLHINGNQFQGWVDNVSLREIL